jgi:hypothetical protein
MPLTNPTTPPQRKAHTVYRAADGRVVPSVTGVLGVIAKPWLIPWANRLGLQGIDSEAHVSQAARIGTLAHAFVETRFTGEVLKRADLEAEHTEEEIAGALRAFRAYQAWAADKTITPILSETPLVSEAHRYGGTFDLYAEVDGRRELLDFKTSERVYDSHLIQLAAYRALLEEHGHPVEAVRVVLMPREPLVIDYEPSRVMEDTGREWSVFLAARQLYEAQKEIERTKARASRERRKARETSAATDIDWSRFED